MPQRDDTRKAMRRFREILLYCFASLLLSVAVFGDALIGRSILAPVDIAPALWARFGHVDPQSNGIPMNHRIVDQLSYDLPMQWSIYHSYRRGEVPWWDPYTLCGRPLLADAHANASDPVRVLLYLAVPNFVVAYNWTLIVHHMVLGLGMFVLLRRFRSSISVSIGLALAFQMGGTFLAVFGHPWVTATLAWYPWLWAAWHTAWERKRWWSWPATLAVAAIFFSGNLQSHAYLPVFGLCFAAGYSGASLQRWKGALFLLGTSGLVGAFIAAPVLGPELELFMNRGQGRGIGSTGGQPWHGALEFAGLWPWTCGAFRTIGLADGSFQLFAGVVTPLLAIIGARKSKDETAWTENVRRAALWCVAVNFLVVCTPLINIFYMRISGIGLMGIVILAAFGCVKIRELSSKASRRFAVGVLAFTIVIALGTAAVAYLLFPQIEPMIRERMVAHAEADAYLGMGMRLRLAQVAAFPSEMGFLNPEIIIGLTTLLLGAAVFKRPALLALLILLNAAGPALVARRSLPRPPVDQWERLLAGSEEQQALVSRVGAGRLRQGNAFDRQFGRFFPMQTAHFFGVHIFDGYSAIAPSSYALEPDFDPTLASDFLVTDDAKIEVTNPNGNARFHWRDHPEEIIATIPQGLNKVSVSFDRRSGGTLIRTDTFYPGWRATTADGKECETLRQGVFSVIKIPEGSGRVDFEYRPAMLATWFSISLSAFLACAISICIRLTGGQAGGVTDPDAEAARRKTS